MTTTHHNRTASLQQSSCVPSANTSTARCEATRATVTGSASSASRIPVSATRCEPVNTAATLQRDRTSNRATDAMYYVTSRCCDSMSCHVMKRKTYIEVRFYCWKGSFVLWFASLLHYAQTKYSGVQLLIHILNLTNVFLFHFSKFFTRTVHGLLIYMYMRVVSKGSLSDARAFHVLPKILLLLVLNLVWNRFQSDWCSTFV